MRQQQCFRTLACLSKRILTTRHSCFPSNYAVNDRTFSFDPTYNIRAVKSIGQIKNEAIDDWLRITVIMMINVKAFWTNNFLRWLWIWKLIIPTYQHNMITLCQMQAYSWANRKKEVAWTFIKLHYQTIIWLITLMGYSIWNPHTPSGRFMKHLTQRECEFQVNNLIWYC